MIASVQDADKVEWKAVQERIRAQLFPIVKPIAYPSEEALYEKLWHSWEDHWDPTDERYFALNSSCVLFSQRINQFNTTPYLFFHGPPDSGKTRALDLLRLLCRNALKTSNVSPAAIYQFLTETHGTLLVDETDKWGLRTQNGPSERTLELIQILNGGYRRGDYVIRANRDGGKPIFYDTFGFKAGAGTELWPATLLERCIVVEMNENIRSIPPEIRKSQLEPLQGMLEMYYTVYDLGRAGSNSGVPQPREIDVSMDQLRDRVGDNRIAELYYGPYICCPSSSGRKALLELARETVAARAEEKAGSDLGLVAETVVTTWLLNKQPDSFSLEDVTQGYTQYPSAVRDRTKWMGHKLGKLGLSRVREGNRGARLILVSPEKLVRLDRQFRLYLLHEDPRSAKNGENGENGADIPIQHLRQNDFADAANVAVAGGERVLETELSAEAIESLREKIRTCLREDNRPYLTASQLAYSIGTSSNQVERTLASLERNGLVFQHRPGCWRLVK